MELNIIDVFSKVNIKYDLQYMYWDIRTYFRQFVVSFQKFQNHILYYQELEPEPAPDKKNPGAGAAPKQAGSESLGSMI